MEMARIGVMGKHPGYGDFVRAGLSNDVIDALSAWLDDVLPEIRDQAGQDWAAFWDAGQDLRFWVGRGILGATICGVLRPSHDKVGRRFPLILAAEGASVPAPLGEAADQAPWEAIALHLDKMTSGQGGAALLENLTFSVLAEEPDTMDGGSSLWAHRADRDLGALLRDAELADAQRAQLARSYWWTVGDADTAPPRAATWLGCQGLPGPHALGWLLTGVAVDPEA